MSLLSAKKLLIYWLAAVLFGALVPHAVVAEWVLTPYGWQWIPDPVPPPDPYPSYAVEPADPNLLLDAGRQLGAQQVYAEQLQRERDVAVGQAALGRAEANRLRQERDVVAQQAAAQRVESVRLQWERDAEQTRRLQERAALLRAVDRQKQRNQEDAFRRAMQYEALMRTRL
jgi:hypothetical protein